MHIIQFPVMMQSEMHQNHLPILLTRPNSSTSLLFWDDSSGRCARVISSVSTVIAVLFELCSILPYLPDCSPLPFASILSKLAVTTPAIDYWLSKLFRKVVQCPVETGVPSSAEFERWLRMRSMCSEWRMCYFAEGEYCCEILGGLVFGGLHFGIAFELRHGFCHFAVLLECWEGQQCVAFGVVVHDVVREEGTVVLAERQLVEHSLFHWRHVLFLELHLEIEYL